MYSQKDLENFFSTFNRVREQVPAYREFLSKGGCQVDGLQINEESLSLIPLASKDSYFAPNRFSSLCIGGKLPFGGLVFTSSGYSGVFSFGYESNEEIKAAIDGLDAKLISIFRADVTRVLLINALTPGVRIHASAATVFEVGLRVDAALAVLKQVAPAYDQILIIGEHLFVKHLIEQARDRRIAVDKIPTHIVTGGELVPESWRSYVKSLTITKQGIQGEIMLSFGISELATSLGLESPFCAELRARMSADRELHKAIFGDAPAVLPTMIEWPRDELFVETIGEPGSGELVVTTLSPSRTVPLVRYATGDRARIVSAAAVKECYQRFGIQPMFEPFGPEILALWGRVPSIETPQGRLYADTVKEALYLDFDLAKRLTGRFTLAPTQEQPLLRVQLKERSPLKQFNSDLLTELVRKVSGHQVRVQPRAFSDFGCSSYERKFKYVA